MRWLKPLLALSLVAGLAACSKVPAGTVGVRVDMYGGHKGVDSTVLKPGRYWIGPNQQLFDFPTFTQNYTWTASKTEGSPTNESFTFQDSGGLSLNADVGITYQILPKNVPLVFQKYREGVKELTGTVLRNMVRNALVDDAGNMPVEQIYGTGRTTLMHEVLARVQREAARSGITVDNLFWAGEIRLPPAVKASINAKIQAVQKAQQIENEVAQAKAEAQKKVADAEGVAQSRLINAKSEAEANEEVAKSITPALIQWRYAKRWDGHLPRFTGSGALPFISMSEK